MSRNVRCSVVHPDILHVHGDIVLIRPDTYRTLSTPAFSASTLAAPSCRVSPNGSVCVCIVDDHEATIPRSQRYRRRQPSLPPFQRTCIARAFVMRKYVQRWSHGLSPNFIIFPRVNHPGSASFEGFLPKISGLRALQFLVGTTSEVASTPTSAYVYLRSTDVLKIRSSTSTSVVYSSRTKSNADPVDLSTIRNETIDQRSIEVYMCAFMDARQTPGGYPKME